MLVSAFRCAKQDNRSVLGGNHIRIELCITIRASLVVVKATGHTAISLSMQVQIPWCRVVGRMTFNWLTRVQATVSASIHL